MSLILEALRKSEAERRRGEAPGLRVELPPVAPPGRRAVSAWLGIAGLAVVLLAALALAALWPRGSGADVDGQVTATPARIEAPPAPPAPPATAPAHRPGIGSTAGVGEAFPPVDRIAGGGPLEAAGPSPVDTGPAHGTSPTGPPAATPSLDPAPAAATDDVPAIPAAAPSDAAIPRITELASAQRQRLPAMKLSMHMWNEEPGRRFVVIDGQRRVEGDRVGEARIAAIDREGVLLDLDGRQVRVPLP